MTRLELIRQRIETECADFVVWAAAHGPFTKHFQPDAPQVSRPRAEIELLIVTSMNDWFEAHMELAEKVFGPVFTDLGKLIDYRVWTLADWLQARKTVLKHIGQFVVLYESPEMTHDGAE